MKTLSHEVKMEEKLRNKSSESTHIYNKHLQLKELRAISVHVCRETG